MKRVTRTDLALAAALGVLGLLFATAVDFSVDEDAAMLLRYAQNFAQTGTLSFNLGGPPVDGASDLLFVLLLAGLSPPAFEGSDLTGIAESHVIHGVVAPPERAKLAEAALQGAKLAG